MSTDQQSPECSPAAQEVAADKNRPTKADQSPRSETKSPNKQQPTHTAYGLQKSEQGKEYFRRIGAGWDKSNGGVSVFINDANDVEHGRPFTLHRNKGTERER